MNNILSSFTLYEILRIILPGFYFVINVFLYVQNVFNENEFDSFLIISLSLIFTILVGAAIYSLDLPRWLKPILKRLPTNRMKNDPFFALYNFSEKRGEENLYYDFYYQQNSDLKVKTEIQSGFYHLFINLLFIGLIFLVLHFHAFFFLEKLSIVLPFLINLVLCFISGISTIIIYKNKLSYSWDRNYNEFKEYLRKKNARRFRRITRW